MVDAPPGLAFWDGVPPRERVPPCLRRTGPEVAGLRAAWFVRQGGPGARLSQPLPQCTWCLGRGSSLEDGRPEQQVGRSNREEMQTVQREGFSQISSKESGRFSPEEGKAVWEKHTGDRSSCGHSGLWERV